VKRALALLLLLAGCSVGPDYERPETVVSDSYKETPQAWKEGQPSDAIARGKWWEMFGDPELSALVEKVEKARSEGDQFMSKYMLDGRNTYSTIIGELDRAATQVGLKPRERQFQSELIEGSENLGMMTISANYEGPYLNVTKFINELDRSPRFLIIESLQAAPQPVGQGVNVNFKLNAFIKDDTGGLQ